MPYSLDRQQEVWLCQLILDGRGEDHHSLPLNNLVMHYMPEGVDSELIRSALQVARQATHDPVVSRVLYLRPRVRAIQPFRLRKIPDDATERSSCPICLEEFRLQALVPDLACKHIFHETCLLEWYKQHDTCPICRSRLEDAFRTSATRNVAEREWNFIQSEGDFMSVYLLPSMLRTSF